MGPRGEWEFHDSYVHFPFYLVKNPEIFPTIYERDDSDLKKNMDY